jgi:hypothetical protein
MEKYRTIMRQVTRLLKKRGCHIDITEIEDDEYLLEIIRNDLSLLSYIQIYNTAGIIEQKWDRKEKEDKEEPCFVITCLFTSVHHRNQHYALLLLLYALSFLKTRFPRVNYAKLDDVSSRSTWINRNVFHLVGFLPQGDVALHPTKSNELVLSGPEKQLCLRDFFMDTAIRLLLQETSTRV